MATTWSPKLLLNLPAFFVLFAAALAAMCAIARAAEPAAAADANTEYASMLDDLRAMKASPDAIRKLAGDKVFRPLACNPVLSTGRGDSWDAFALGSMTVVKAGELYHMYYEAWGQRDYASLQIGHAVSADGIHWAKDPANPVLPKGAAGEWDADGTWDPFVLCEDGKFKMWYGGGKKVCDWGYAESADGRHWVKKGRLSKLGGVEDCHVVHDRQAGRYCMYYWDRAHEKTGKALFVAESADETHFDFAAARKVTIEGEQYPCFYKFSHVIQADGGWHMFYANFKRPGCADALTRYATSPDGLNWKKVNGNLLAGMDGEVLPLADDLYLMYYCPAGHFDQDDCDIRLAIFGGSLKDLAAARPGPGPGETGR